MKLYFPEDRQKKKIKDIPLLIPFETPPSTGLFIKVKNDHTVGFVDLQTGKVVFVDETKYGIPYENSTLVLE